MTDLDGHGAEDRLNGRKHFGLSVEYVAIYVCARACVCIRVYVCVCAYVCVYVCAHVRSHHLEVLKITYGFEDKSNIFKEANIIRRFNLRISNEQIQIRY